MRCVERERERSAEAGEGVRQDRAASAERSAIATAERGRRTPTGRAEGAFLRGYLVGGAHVAAAGHRETRADVRRY